ncbi:S8 family serine peptidase [Sulfurovum sp. zt1-1]|uniref:S8 family serine peptidase n=1 Tax=Sulfurovum zhangzhouensis TaxID=3019067 RepID=A0ABT7QZ95_9BACT|nr:S8 family serine peptidase [Sulfurovum zhangzhouensis]MDM5272165.1 S8 family serine peptidase [Sulfurovum zhangzhouensis]
MKKYFIGLMITSLLTLPALSDNSTVMQKLIDTIEVKSKPTDTQIPQKKHVQVIAILNSKDAQVSFMQAVDTNKSNFKIKKSFPLVQAKEKNNDASSTEAPAQKQVLVISSSTLSIDELIETIKKMPGVESVTEDHVVHTYEVIPDDPKFEDLWGLDNNNVPITDINVTEAWEFSTGSNEVVVGIIDSGVDYTHSDLSANIWTNPNEIPDNGKDDDHNGYVDDIHGIDTFNGDSDPMDDNMHGTHVAGTIGAVGDNANGVTGVNWNVKMAVCKFLDSAGEGYTSDALECVNYFNALKQDGINIVALNNSWGGVGEDYTFEQAVQTANNENILFVAAAGNEGTNNDATPTYPASYTTANVVSVAASDINGNLASFSNYGMISVDLAAPGVEIWSTIPSTCTPNNTDIFFTDDFENGTNKWEFLTYNTSDLSKTDIPSEHWQLDNLLFTSPFYSLSDSPGTTYNNNRTQIALTKNTINLSGATSTENAGVCISLKIYGRTETDWDTLNIQLSKDEGASWYSFSPISGNIPNWTEFSFLIPKEYLVSNLRVALTRISDGSIVYQGYNIDDISITSGTINHNNYAAYSGTSMATPHVSGAIALLASIDNNLNASQRKQILLNNVTYKSTYETKIATSGLLNAGAMLSHANEAPISSSGGGGGGCTYNPNLKKFDAMFFMLFMLSLLYPWRRKFIK